MIIDTDVGYDDLLAILYLLATGADITAFTVVNGICEVPDGANALLRMQEKLGLPTMIPVYKGASIGQPNCFPDAWRQQANNLGWGTPDPSHHPQSFSAGAFFIQQLELGPVTLLALGPQTNIAPAVETASPCGQLTMTAMCGAFEVPGNLPENAPVAEANLYVDAPSAQNVFGVYYQQSSSGGATVVPLDACGQVPIDAAFISAFQAAMGSGVKAQLAWQILQQINTEFVNKGVPYFAYDPLAAVVMTNPGIIVNAAPSSIEIGQDGQSTATPGGQASIVYSVAPGKFQDIFIRAFAG